MLRILSVAAIGSILMFFGIISPRPSIVSAMEIFLGFVLLVLSIAAFIVTFLVWLVGG